jgi:hypothetical protein
MLEGLEKGLQDGSDSLNDQIVALELHMDGFKLWEWIRARREESKRGTEVFSRYNAVERFQAMRLLKTDITPEQSDMLLDNWTALSFDMALDNNDLATNPAVPDNQPSTVKELSEEAESRPDYPYDWGQDNFEPDLTPYEVDKLKMHPGYRQAMAHMVSGLEHAQRIEGAKMVFDEFPGMKRQMLEVFNMEIHLIVSRFAAWIPDPVRAASSAIEFAETHAGKSALPRIRGSLDKVLLTRAQSIRAGQASGPYGNPEQDSEALLRVFASTHERAEAMIEYL